MRRFQKALSVLLVSALIGIANVGIVAPAAQAFPCYGTREIVDDYPSSGEDSGAVVWDGSALDSGASPAELAEFDEIIAEAEAEAEVGPGEVFDDDLNDEASPDLEIDFAYLKEAGYEQPALVEY